MFTAIASSAIALVAGVLLEFPRRTRKSVTAVPQRTTAMDFERFLIEGTSAHRRGEEDLQQLFFS
jgi:hypothetical protein